MACAEAALEHLLVVAIHIGTRFSGYACQTLGNFKDDPLKIHAFTWKSGANGGLSTMTPTCVLFDPSQNFHSFGLEAEDKYAELAQGDDHRNWYYFRRFKMNLYKNSDIPRDLPLEDDQGKHLPAIKVISESLSYLREDVMKVLSKGAEIRPNEINWVLTVPASWSDAAKQFMREAAVKGGIPNSQLMLVLETDAASIYCKHILNARKVVGGKSCLDAFSSGSKHLILDAGGVTIDITVQEVQYDGTIKQLYMANAGDWGVTKVYQAFEDFLQELVGAQTIYRFRDENKSDYLDLIQEFDIKLRSIHPDQTSKVTFKVPISLKETFEKENGYKESISQSSKRVTWVGDKLRMEPESARELFKSTCDYITDYLEKIFSDPKVKGTNTILMVGEFSESPMLNYAVEKAFPDKTIIKPKDARLAVLNGAVLFGFETRIISPRICKATYGVKINSPFEEGVDPVKKKVIIEGDVLCSDRFHKHVEIHQAVGIDEEFEEQTYVPIRSDQTAIRFEIWTSENAHPRYTSDPGCSYHGELTVQIPDTTEGKKRKVGVKMIFGRTELHVRAINIQNGEETTAEFDFLRSPILRDVVEKTLPYKTIIMPQEAGLSVLAGAVLFGFEPRRNIKQICERIQDVKTDSTFQKGPGPVYKKIPDQSRTLLEQDQCQKDNEVPVSDMHLTQSELLKSLQEKEDLLQEHKQEITTLELENDMLNKENEDIMIDFKEKSKRDEEKISKLQDDYEVLLSTYSSEKRMHQDNDRELRQLRTEIRICKKEKTQLKKALKDQTQNNLELKDKLRDLELERSSCWQCDEYERTVFKLKKEKQELQDKYKVKDEQLQNAAKENQQLIDDIDQLKSNIIGHVQEIKSLNTSIEVMKEENSRKDCYTTTSLPDPDRPANLGRRFCEIFEEEWSEALSELNGDNRTNIDYLRNIVTESYLFAKTSAEKYLDNLDDAILQINRSVQVMEPNIIKINKDHRRIIANYLAKDLHKSFMSGSQTYIGYGPHLTSFMKKLVPLCFKMVLHEPPLVLSTNEEGIIDPASFEPYQESSGEMNYVIWPALYLQEGGIVLCKGIAGGSK